MGSQPKSASAEKKTRGPVEDELLLRHLLLFSLWEGGFEAILTREFKTSFVKTETRSSIEQSKTLGFTGAPFPNPFPNWGADGAR